MRQHLRTRNLLQLLGIVAMFLLPAVITDSYVMHLFVLTLVYSMLTLSLNIITGYSGLVSLGHHAFFGLGAYTAAILAVNFSIPFPLGLLLAGLVAMSGGYFISGITLKLRSAFFVIATVAFAEILRIVSLTWFDLTNGPLGIANIPPPSVGEIALETPFQAYYVILLLVIGAVYVTNRLVNSEVGRSLVALKEAEYLAKAVGLDIKKYLMTSVMAGAFIAGASGAFYAHYMRFISPDIFYFTMSVTIIIMLVCGGLGSTWGPIIGAFIFTFVPELLRFSDQYRMILYAITLIAFIRFMPQGIWGVITKLFQRKNVENTESAEKGVSL